MNSISNYSTVESVSGNVNLGYAAIGKMEANLQNLCNAGPTDSEVLVESSAEKWKIFMEGKIRKYHERNALNRANFAYASRCRRIAGRLNGADPLAIAKFLCGQNLKNLVEMANVIGEMNPEKAAKALSLIEDVEIRICIIFGMDPVKAANILNQMEESQVNGLLWRIFAPCMNAIRPEIAAIMGAMDPEKLKTLVADAARKCLSEGNCRSRWQPHFTFAEHLLRMPPLAVVRIFNSLNWTEHGEKDAMAAAVLLSKGLILEEGNSRIGAIFYHINNPKMEEKIIANLEKIHARDICWGSNVNDESYKNSNAKQVWLEGEKRIFEAKGLWAAASYINSDVRSGRVALEIIQMEDCDKAVKTIEHMALDPAAAAAVLEDYSTFEESLKQVKRESLAEILPHVADPQIALEILLLREYNLKEWEEIIRQLNWICPGHLSRIIGLMNPAKAVKILSLLPLHLAATVMNSLAPESLIAIMKLTIATLATFHFNFLDKILNSMKPKKVARAMVLMDDDWISEAMNLMDPAAADKVRAEIKALKIAAANPNPVEALQFLGSETKVPEENIGDFSAHEIAAANPNPVEALQFLGSETKVPEENIGDFSAHEESINAASVFEENTGVINLCEKSIDKTLSNSPVADENSGKFLSKLPKIIVSGLVCGGSAAVLTWLILLALGVASSMWPLILCVGLGTAMVGTALAPILFRMQLLI